MFTEYFTINLSLDLTLDHNQSKLKLFYYYLFSEILQVFIGSTY